MLSVKLPTRYYRARVLKVSSYNCVEALLELQFGVSVTKSIILEGVQSSSVPKMMRKEAHHFLVALIGGKNIIVQVEDASRSDGYFLGRVFLAEKTFGEPEGLVVPLGLDVPLLEVGTFFLAAVKNGFNIKDVWAIFRAGGK